MPRPSAPTPIYTSCKGPGQPTALARHRLLREPGGSEGGVRDSSRAGVNLAMPAPRCSPPLVESQLHRRDADVVDHDVALIGKRLVACKANRMSPRSEAHDVDVRHPAQCKVAVVLG